MIKFDEKGHSLLSWRQQLIKKQVSSLEVCSTYLKQIEQKNNPLNVYLVINQQLLEEAKRADQAINNNPEAFKNQPLLGLPIAIKDNFCTLDFPTTASSLVLNNYHPPYESTVTQKLKKAGAIILGKTNMDAWAHGSSTETSDFGPTKNPHDTNRTPGGSSGGSAAAVAADMAPAAIGSETAGSIRQPAAWCGVIGLKPTYGRVSRWGVIAMASSLDCPGPITKTVADAAFIYNLLAGPDDHDATTIKSPAPKIPIKKTLPEKKLTIGLPKEYFSLAKKEISQKIIALSKQLKKSGHQIREISLLDPKISIAVYTILQRAEVSSNLARYDGIRYGQNRAFFGLESLRRIMLGTFVLSAGYFDQYYLQAQKARTKIINNFADTFKKVDLILAPTTPTTALKVGAWKKSAMFGEMQDVLVEPSALAGLPAINLLAGSDRNGLPIGLQIIGPQKQESRVVKLAYQIEAITNEKN
ncbi:MAG: Asp-tRNA(Asn)/Glu-tRNA(Gln) amidotransferase subunit GatA [Candidatus Shapirobacteria bacterium]|nr:Asp-tRNA(Asn)/Glu-tRNA(Gln) amidotransferase subunit GatA [Candidatus Shapirobacteria bacterium]MDD5073721.1 Asp-tRNA(Asn)/Glu-tRNA(Gln) amidotransferase subunit GatA [Candidatus Shapirobacteria bacterium]MDD5481710.1 Asp-tRNA(Asn)/Glu-tRNA(Gln) amidotransferase subunit GatA [Candidatus Shapirobacteria bacterium]